MPAYSFCLLDSAGMTHDYFVKNFRSDEDARASADRMVSRSAGVEVWAGHRLVERLGARRDEHGEIRARASAARTAERRPGTRVAEELA
jgi:hypothetical protein